MRKQSYRAILAIALCEQQRVACRGGSVRVRGWQGDRCFNSSPYCLCVHCCTTHPADVLLAWQSCWSWDKSWGILLSEACLIMEILLIYSGAVRWQPLCCPGIYWGFLWRCACVFVCVRHLDISQIYVEPNKKRNQWISVGFN